MVIDPLVVLYAVITLLGIRGIIRRARRLHRYAVFEAYVRGRLHEVEELEEAEGWTRDASYRLGLKILFTVTSAGFMLARMFPDADSAPLIFRTLAACCIGGGMLWLTHWTDVVEGDRKRRSLRRGEVESVHD